MRAWPSIAKLLVPAAAVLAASAARAAPQPASLPAKARLKLEELTPPVARPARSSAPRTMPARVADMLAEAEKLLDAGRYSDAASILERAVAYEPNNARLHRLLGRAYFGLPNLGKAMAHLKEALRHAADDLESHLLIGQLYAAQKQRDEAILHLRTALKCSGAAPENPLAGEALLTLGLLLDNQGYWTAALECYDRLTDWIARHGRPYAERPALQEWVLRPERLQTRRGAALLLLGRAGDAAAQLERAYRRDRTDPRPAKLLIEALLRAGQSARAEALLVEMAAQPALRAAVPAMASDLCAETGDANMPARLWQAHRKAGKGDPALAVALARVAQRHGWLKQAAGILQSVAAEAPADADLWRVLCTSYASQKHYAGLLAAMEQALRRNEGALDALAAGIVEIPTVTTDDVDRKLAELIRRGESPVKPALLYLAGLLAAAKDRHLLAADLFRDAIDARKDFYRAYEALLDACLARKRTDQAERVIEEVGRMAKDKPWADYLRGKAALAAGQTREAITALERAAQNDQKDLSVVRLLVRAYLAAGRNGEAETTLARAIRDWPDDGDLHRHLFDLYVGRRQYDEAQAVAMRLLRRQDDSLPARLMLVELALLGGRRRDALRLLAELRKQAPEDAEVQLLSVRGLLGTGGELLTKEEFDEAAERLSALIRTQPAHRRARQQLADLLSAVGKRGEAAGLLGTLYEETPNDGDLARKYVAMLLRTKQHAVALRAVRRFREANGEDMWGRLAELGLLADLKQYDEAARLAEKWVADAPGDTAKVLYRQELLRILDQARLYQKALQLVEAWMGSPPRDEGDRGERDERLRVARLRLRAAMGQWDKVHADLDELLRDDPLSRAPRLVAAEAVDANSFESALKVLTRSVETVRGVADDLAALAKAVRGLARPDAPARKDYERLIEKAPRLAREAVKTAVDSAQYDRALRSLDAWGRAAEESLNDLRATRIIVQGKAKDVAAARQEAEAWIARDPNALTPRRVLVAVLADANDYAAAEGLVDGWLKQLAPTTLPSQPAEGGETRRWLIETSVRLRVSRRHCDEALRRAEAALRADPNNIELLSLKSTALTELGRNAEAVAALEKAHAADSDDASLNNNLAYLYAEQGISLDKAERMVAKALRERPGTVAFIDTQGWVLYKQGRFREAGGVFRSLAEQWGDEDIEHGVILDHAGDVYYRLGWKDKAMELWKRAVTKARADTRPQRETEQLLRDTPEKVRAAYEGRAPKLAPLGKGTEAATSRPADGGL